MSAYADYLRSAQWREVSARRREIDGYKCVCCGSADNLNVHHVNYPPDWYNTTTEHLVTLCHDCHLIIHKSQEQYDKWREWKITKNGYLDTSNNAFPKFMRDLVMLAGVECWRHNRFTTADVGAWIRKINEVLSRDEKRAIFRISVADTMDFLAFAKDCYIANKSPVIKADRRKYKKKSKTRFKD